MEKFLDWLCGSSDYTIIRCQKVTKGELRERIKASFAKDRASIEQQVQADSSPDEGDKSVDKWNRRAAILAAEPPEKK